MLSFTQLKPTMSFGQALIIEKFKLIIRWKLHGFPQLICDFRGAISLGVRRFHANWTEPGQVR